MQQQKSGIKEISRLTSPNFFHGKWKGQRVPKKKQENKNSTCTSIMKYTINTGKENTQILPDRKLCPKCSNEVYALQNTNLLRETKAQDSKFPSPAHAIEHKET